VIGTIRSLLSGAILSGTPLLYATIAEVIGERAGVVNLGLEGVMLVGAVVSFVAMVHTESAMLAVAAGALAGAFFNLIFAFLVITRRANQLASGLALMSCGVGLSALIGSRYVGSQIVGLPELPLPYLAGLPVVGAVLFRHDALVYAAVPVAVAVWWGLFRTRWGLTLRAVGENPTAAFAAGKDPYRLQYQALFVAGLLGGIAGAHLCLAVARTWTEWMTAGRGFVAVALVIFSRWQPLRAVGGALLFGGAIALELQLQVIGVPMSPFLLDMLPYLLSLAVLVAGGGARRDTAPGSLGRVFQRSD
jgi:simple sugar transport system permease protein